MAAKFANQSNTALRLSDWMIEPQKILPAIEEYEHHSLVSLEQAIEPIVSFVPDVEQLVRTVKHRCLQPEDNLSSDESASIMLYTLDSSFYTILSTTLRDENRQKLKPWFLYLRLITFALSKLPSTASGTVYRGVKEDVTEQFSKGKTLIWWTFSSCTPSIQTIKQYLGQHGSRTMFIIDCDSARNISRHSFYETDNDILLYPVRQFRVVSSFNSENELRVIRLKEIQPNIPLIHIPQPLPVIGSKASYENKKLRELMNHAEYHSKISLYQHKLNDDDVRIVVEAGIKEKRCSELWLEENQITSIGVSSIANALENNYTLAWLSLSSNRVGDIGIQALAKALSFNHSAISTLALHSTGITDKGAGYLAEMLKTNKTLMELGLSENEIGDRGIQNLADALTHYNNTFRWLYLSRNRLVTDSSIHSLIEMFTNNHRLQELRIDNCDLTEEGKERLRQSAKLKKNFYLTI